MNNILKYLFILFSYTIIGGCKVPQVNQRIENKTVPFVYDSLWNKNADTTSQATIPWKSFFTDKYLIKLIDTALKNNQELLITLQEIEVAKNEVMMRQGKLLPSVTGKVSAGFEKVGRFTSQGAGDASTEIIPGKEVPEVLPDYGLTASLNWEADIWKKLRNAKKSAVLKFLATSEGKNFVLTNLIAEIANAYYELIALDKQLEIVQRNIALQQNALEVVKVQKEAARATELAVKKFEAEVFKTQSLEYEIKQNIKEVENNIHLLLGHYPQQIERASNNFLASDFKVVSTGIPSQLLANRADIRQAELMLEAAKLDVKVARAEFFPSFTINANVGFQAFKPNYLFRLPESALYALAGELTGPLINKNAIKAEFLSANAKQMQAMYDYERTILTAYLEVSTQLSNIDNLNKGYSLKNKQVEALDKSITIASDLFKFARADYLEVLMTQRDALEATLDLIETKKKQYNAFVNVYKALGGGWQ